MTDLSPAIIDNYVEALIDAHHRDLAREVVLSHPAVFSAYFFGRKLKDFHADTVWYAHTTPRLWVLYPEAHGKSTLIAHDLLLYEICRNRNIRICLMMKTDETAWDYAKNILMPELDPTSPQCNRRLWDMFGPFEGDVWTVAEMNFAGRQIVSDAPTIRFVGAKPTLVGKGCDWLIADDIVHDENSETDEQRRKLIKRWNTTWQSMPRSMFDHDPETGWLQVPANIDWPRDEDGRPVEYERITGVGTAFHVEDLHSSKAGSMRDRPKGELFRGADPTYLVLYYDCFRDEAETEALWPEHRSLQWLRDERESRGILEFNKRLRNMPMDEASAAIKEAWIRGGFYSGVEYAGCLDEHYRVGGLPDKKKLWVQALGVDPASGRRTKKSSYSAFVLLGAKKSQLETTAELPEIYVVDLFMFQQGFDDIISVMFDGDTNQHPALPGFFETYDYDLVRVEVNDKQNWLMANRRTEEFIRAHPGVVQPWETQGQSKGDEDTGIRSMDAFFKDSHIHIPWERPSDREKMAPLVTQLCNYPEGKNDLVMAFWVALSALRDYLSLSEAFYEPGFVGGLYLENPLYEGGPEQEGAVPGLPVGLGGFLSAYTNRGVAGIGEQPQNQPEEEGEEGGEADPGGAGPGQLHRSVRVKRGARVPLPASSVARKLRVSKGR